MNDPNPSTAPVRVVESESGVVIEVTIAAPVATVWPHLRDSELIGRWHGWDDVTLADEIDFIYQQQMREGEQPYTLETRGGPAPGSFDLGDRFDLRESGAATIVRITRAPKGSGGEWDAMYDDITQGWISFLASCASPSRSSRLPRGAPSSSRRGRAPRPARCSTWPTSPRATTTRSPR